MPRIVFFETEPWEEKYFRDVFTGDDVVFHPHTLSNHPEDDPSIFTAEIISIFIYSQLTKEVIDKFPNLKCIVTRSTGYDHIDTAYCKEKGITVSNVPHYGVHAIAEHAFALILALSRKIIPSVERTRKGDFSLEGLRGMELYGRTLGVIGTGNIGSVVCAIAQGFGMKVIAFNRHPDDDLVKKGVVFVDLPILLAQSDVISIHVPLTPETTHIINRSNIDSIKKGALLVNTARGGIVETEAILDGLSKGIFAGVGLDVLEGECELHEERELLSSEFLKSCDLKTQLLDHMLLGKENVIVTPHNAFDSGEALDHIAKTTVENIQGFLQGKPVNVIS